ncbi:MAG: response regulator transcription factor [Propionibacteriaceae bacterium]|jgi:DNA-binding NarL/FixJ family response regulator|nr:response regulator transcription factor [Propionibacteriaceae bacterium]
MNVLIVDDNPVIRTGLRVVLEAMEEVCSVLEASGGCAALRVVDENPCDLVLLDVDMPLMDGIATLDQIDDVPVVMMTDDGDPQTVREAMAHGAAGYLVYGDHTPTELAAAVRTCVSGGMVMSAPATQALNAEPIQDAKTPNALTPRERQLFTALGKGMSNGQIAQSLKLSEKTIRNYMTNLYAKLGVENRTEAALRWLELGE